MIVSLVGVLRTAIQDWAKGILAPVMPQLKVVGIASGEKNPLPVGGIEWGDEAASGDRPTIAESYDDGRADWIIHRGEVPMAFTWRCRNFEDAELVAGQFIARAATQSARRSILGSRTVPITFTVGGVERHARLYIVGARTAYPRDRSQERSEWIARVPATCVFLASWVDDLDDPTGRIRDIVVTINGVTVTVPIPPTSDPLEEPSDE